MLPNVEPIQAAIRRLQRDRDVAEWDEEDMKQSDLLGREIDRLKKQHKSGEQWAVNF